VLPDDRPPALPASLPPPPAAAGGFFALLVLLQLFLGSLSQLANLTFGLYFTELFLFLAPALLAARALGYRPTELLGTRLPPSRLLLLGFALGLCNYPLAAALEAGVRGLLNPKWQDLFDASAILSSASGLERVLLVLAVGLAAPLGEELAFRGLIQRTLGLSLSPARAIGLTAVLFSAIHFDPIGFPARVELGVLFGVLALWSGSLWTGVAAHAANNLVATGLFYAVGGKAEEGGRPELLQLLGLAAAGLALTAPLLALFRSQTRRLPVAEPPERAPPASLVQPLALWVTAMAASLLLLTAVDYRGIALGLIDVSTPLVAFRKRIPDEPTRGRVEQRLRALRARARRGELSAAGYSDLRGWMYDRREGGPLNAEELATLQKKLEALESAQGPGAASPDGG